MESLGRNLMLKPPRCFSCLSRFNVFAVLVNFVISTVRAVGGPRRHDNGRSTAVGGGRCSAAATDSSEFSRSQ